MTAVAESLSHDDFVDLVAKDVRGQATHREAEWLRSGENVERWYDALNELQRSLDAQLTAKRAEIQARKLEDAPEQFASYEAITGDWRARTVRFKTGVQNRAAEARRLRNEQRNSSYTDEVMRERSRAIREVLRLRTLILDHRDHECGVNCEPECLADLTLWAVLDSEPEV